MKIQCNCGTKYAFDVTPEMVANPIRFICQSCGTDNSAAINQLIQQQFGSAAPPVADAAPPPPEPVAPPAGPTRVKVSMPSAASAGPAASADTPAAPRMCGKHPGHFVSEHCVVCRKPICPKCMELFGYVCSPFCKNEAESRGIDVPVFAGQSSAVQAASWRKFRLVSWSIAAALAAIAGLWGWYTVSLSKPKVVFSVRFDQAADAGGARFVSGDTAIVLHGGRLMRYDLKGKKELWRSELVDRQAVAAEAARLAREDKERYEKAKREGNYTEQELRRMQPSSEDDIARTLEESTAESMRLHVYERNLWVRSPEKMVRYDFDSGKSAQEVPLGKQWVERVIPARDSIVLLTSSGQGKSAVRVNLGSGSVDTQELTEPPVAVAAATPTNAARLAAAQARTTTNRTATATPAVARASFPSPQPNPAMKQFKTTPELSLPQKIAAPVAVANKIRNERLEETMAEDDDGEGGEDSVPITKYQDKTVMAANGKFIRCEVKLLERRIVTREAMKAAPTKSAPDENITVTGTMKVANEMVNEWERERTGGVEKEDESRYEVSLRPLGASSPDWTGEVIGPSEFFALDTVNLLVAGKSLHVFDQSNRKLWESKLNYTVGIVGDLGEDDDLGGADVAPAVERDKSLYFRDSGVLTCFDLASGNVRWRLPTVGVSKMLFDGKGMLYVETTTASAEKLKYSLQVDLSRKEHPLIIKVDPANGKLLWGSENNGRLAHVSGNLIYTLEWQGGVEDGEANPYGLPGAYIPPHVRIRRLSQSNGQVAWEHYQRRGPLDVRFHEKMIEILFRKEFQVLSYWSL